MNRPRRALAALALVFISASRPALAHPLATTEVTLDLREPATAVSLNANAAALIAKLAALSPASAAGTGSDVERVRALSPTLLAHVRVTSGGVLMTLLVESVSVPEPQRVLVRFRAATSTGALPVQWSTDLIYGSYPLVVRTPGAAEPATEWVQGTQPSAEYRAGDRPGRWVQLARMAAMGFTHIVPDGFDHVLFVIGLFLLTTRAKTVLAQVTAFTLAHSVTLGLTLYGVVSLPSAVVEPLIALSIAYVAIENLFTSTLRPWRLALVFAFGLLHGLGFAEALARLDLPQSSLLSSLLAFNVGVEAGQLTVLGAAACVVAAMGLSPEAHRRWITRPASVAIGLTGAFWTAERLLI